MLVRAIGFLGFLAATAGNAADNVVLITFDGLRWQEVFTGLDHRLATNDTYSARSSELLEQFWAETPQERAQLLLPFLLSTIMSQGSVAGDRTTGSCARVMNPWYFSYPGYSEILTGVVNPNIDSNSKIPNPELTIHEMLETQPAWRGRTAAFASWDVFPYIFNTQRSGIHVNAYAASEPAQSDYEQFLDGLAADIPAPWPTIRHDALTHHYAREWLQRERPRLLYISYGETDDFAHDGLYDEYIFAAHRTDRFIAELWGWIQSSEEYAGNTVLFLAVDHGRGAEPIETWQHHASQRSLDGYMNSLAQYEQGIVGSEATWMAAIGPGIAANGLVDTDSNCLGNDQIAATVLQLLGEDYREFNPEMAAPLVELME